MFCTGPWEKAEESPQRSDVEREKMHAVFILTYSSLLTKPPRSLWKQCFWKSYEIARNTCNPPPRTHDLYQMRVVVAPKLLIRCLTNVPCVHSGTPISHLSPSLSWFLRRDLCLHLLSSFLFAPSLLLRSSLSLSSSWQGEITPANQDAFSSSQGWWNTGYQSNGASLVVEISSWGGVFIWSYRSCVALISLTHPTVSQKHTPLWCVCTKDSFCLST